MDIERFYNSDNTILEFDHKFNQSLDNVTLP
ncbi:MAG: hypothetical protein Gaeavirus23_11, partial [Gaeavirus sp.]